MLHTRRILLFIWWAPPLLACAYFTFLTLANAPINVPVFTALSKGFAASYEPTLLADVLAVAIAISTYGLLGLLVQELLNAHPRPLGNMDLAFLLIYCLVLSAAYIGRGPMGALLEPTPAEVLALRDLISYGLGLISSIFAIFGLLRWWPRITIMVMLLNLLFFISGLVVEKPSLYADRPWLFVTGSLYGLALFFSLWVLRLRVQDYPEEEEIFEPEPVLETPTAPAPIFSSEVQMPFPHGPAANSQAGLEPYPGSANTDSAFPPPPISKVPPPL